MSTKTKTAKPLTAERLKELMRYDPGTGTFVRLQTRAANAPQGAVAGYLNRSRGYPCIGVDGRYYTTHRLAWLYMTGEWPAGDVDHIDGDAQNNRWTNLRVVSEHENLQNQRRPHRNNKCGLLGVSRCGNSWQSRIRVSGHSRHLGTFTTPEQAHAAYVEAKRRHHPGCTI